MIKALSRIELTQRRPFLKTHQLNHAKLSQNSNPQTAQPTSKPEQAQTTKHSKTNNPQEVVVLSNFSHLLKRKNRNRASGGLRSRGLLLTRQPLYRAELPRHSTIA
jgi:hypothetical protein